MLGIPRRYGHFVFGVLQAGLTTAIATAIAGLPFLAESTFLLHWLGAWAVAWAAMTPVVLLASPVIRRLVEVLTVADLTRG